MTYQIPQIELLKGSHANTGTTGQGCFMNVIAYLNGESAITDQSSCVCVTVRPIAIWINDYMNDAERKQLLPYILRAMGSATEDKAELVRRAWLCAEFSKQCAARAAAASADAASAAAAWAAAASADAARAAAASADAAWAAAASAAAASADAARADAAWAAAARADAARADAAWAAAARAHLISDALKILDAMLPPLSDPQAIHVERIERLAELAGSECR